MVALCNKLDLIAPAKCWLLDGFILLAVSLQNNNLYQVVLITSSSLLWDFIYERYVLRKCLYRKEMNGLGYLKGIDWR